MITFPKFQTERPAPYAQTTVSASSRNHKLIAPINSAFEDAMGLRGRLRNEAYHVHGFSGRKFRLLLNNLLHDIDDARYLEIGLFHGASFCSAVSNNRHIKALGVDNWSEFGGKREHFDKNLASFAPVDADIKIIEADFRSVDYQAAGPFNILFYDGSHTEQDQYDGVAIPQPSLDAQFILIIDDWNWSRVRKGTYDALKALHVTIDYQIEVRTTFNDESLPVIHGGGSEWHNGCLIAAASKKV